MQYFRNHEIAKLHNISQATVGKWIKSAQQGKLPLVLRTQDHRAYIANTPDNIELIERLVEGRRKYRNGRASNPFSGVWHSIYRVPSGPDKEVIQIEHYMVMYQEGSRLVVESLPNIEGSYMIARFSLDGRIATGTYHSQNTPKTAAKGAVYYGAAQMVLAPDCGALRGKGVGFGKDMEVKMSEWELVHIGQRPMRRTPASSKL